MKDILESHDVQHAQSAPEKLYAVPTFECLGIYYQSENSDGCQIRYREMSTKDWRTGLDLVYDPRNSEYRGSLVGLKSDTEYEVELTCGQKQAPIQCRTLNEIFPVGQTTVIEDGAETVHITESGTPEAYHLVEPPQEAKSTIDIGNVYDYALVVDADYVILRGLELKNAAIHGILIKPGRHHIVIEDCHVTFWGRVGGPKTFGNTGGMDSAIYAEEGAGRLVIQRNLLEHPRGGANDWETGHPGGPQGISLINTIGGNVIRYNEILSTEDHGFNDGIGGGSNYSFAGSPNRDTDMYGNIIRNVWDDAIESEGANMNVRIWGNYLHLTFQHIATACTSMGPLYIFRNIFGESRWTHQNTIGGSMIKTGENNEFGGGRRFIFHNTALQPGGAFHAFSSHPNPNCVTRNNIFNCPGRLASSRPVDDPGDFDYGLFTGMDKGVAKEPHGIHGKPALIESYYLEFYPASTTTTVQWGKVPFDRGGKEQIITDPVVTLPNPIIDAGDVIPGFNDDYTGKAPDLGAFERGRPPLRFGRRAQSLEWAPWEKYS